MNKTVKIIGIISLIFLLAGVIMKSFYVPNQLIILASGIVLFALVVLPYFLVFNLKRSVNWKEKLLHITGFLTEFIFMVSFALTLQRMWQIFKPVTITAGILSFGYFIFLILNRKDLSVEKVKWQFLTAYIAMVILIFMNLPVEMQGAAMFYNPPVSDPSYEKGQGPVIYIDQGHHNFHTLDGRLRSTGHLLERDGYNVLAYDGQFESERLKESKILMMQFLS